MKYIVFGLALLALFGCLEVECPADADSRAVLYEEELARVAGTTDGFVVFQSGNDFVQFAGTGNGLILDVPSQMLSGDREQKLLGLLGDSYRNEFEGGYSIQASVSTAGEGAALAESVFRNVYGLPADYPVSYVATESSEKYPCG